MGAIFLVGMMGSGKTTIGKRLSKNLGIDFVDVDQDIEATTGVSVSTIFELEGEAGFRDREAKAVRSIASSTHPRVVATGGGAVLNPSSRASMSATGFVVYLHAPAELLFARTRHDKMRPLLQVDDPLTKIRGLVERRDPLYREIANIVLESSSGIANIMNCIVSSLPTTCQS